MQILCLAVLDSFLIQIILDINRILLTPPLKMNNSKNDTEP